MFALDRQKQKGKIKTWRYPWSALNSPQAASAPTLKTTAIKSNVKSLNAWCLPDALTVLFLQATVVGLNKEVMAVYVCSTGIVGQQRDLRELLK